MLEFLGLKRAAECNGQRFKWTFGARVMIIFSRSVDPSLDRSIASSRLLVW